ncbi:MAG: histidine phosphatase family protein [Clostridia bacterium]|nr:histidine phosphatase family protein [Clostridia bacterium]
MIYFIRHGQTEWNVLGLMQGQTDIPLNDTGRAQAKQMAKSLQGITFDKVFCSPLSRALETCQAVVDASQIVTDKRIAERYFGEFEGESAMLMRSRKFWNTNANQTFDRAESLFDFVARVYDFLDYVVQNCKGQNVLIVAHGGVGMVVQSYFLGEPTDGEYLTYLVDNCQVLKFNF